MREYISGQKYDWAHFHFKKAGSRKILIFSGNLILVNRAFSKND
jgi:hypothetical protein